ncbi:MAG: Wadjet anti-phage system protein JetA family protein [Candidatus Izemoplasmatales bacterium]
MNIFDIVPKQFFSLLSSKNNRIYVSCILELFKVYEQGSILGLDKNIAKQAIVDYLDINPLEEELEIEEDDEEDALLDNRDRANQILRRLEECEWIDIDVNNDYEEIINFRDYAITVIEALKEISNDIYYGEDNETHEFRGYIYTVYSLLSNDHGEFALTIDQVYKNTIAFVREIRKLDSRLKYYIKTIVENSEIKDLINLLVNYKVELVDNAYRRLKTSDNINKYRTDIVKKLEEYQQNPSIMELISKEYLSKNHNDPEIAMIKANKKIDDIIDIYNSISYIIDEIDNKNKIYVNTTIAKIKFLLSDDENVISKLSRILNYTGTNIRKNRTRKVMDEIAPLFTINSYQQLSSKSIYTPRGIYKHAEAQYLVENNGAPDRSLQEDFYSEFETAYSEDVIAKYLKTYFRHNKSIKASEIMRDDMSDESIIRLLYILVYAGEELDYSVNPLFEKIKNKRFDLDDFEIIRGYQG